MTRKDRERYAGWVSPYAPDPACEHERGAVEVTPPFQQPPVDWSKPMGGFVILPREWACMDCGTPVSPHAYRGHQLHPLPEDVRRASVTHPPPLSLPEPAAHE